MRCRWSRIRCSWPKFRRPQRANKKEVASGEFQIGKNASSSFCLRFGHSDVFVGATVVEEETINVLHQPFNEDNVGYLADFLPIFFGGEDGGVGTGEEFPGIAPVEDGDAGAIDKFVVGAVVDQEDAARCEDWRGAGLGPAGVEPPRAGGENTRAWWMGPVEGVPRAR